MVTANQRQKLFVGGVLVTLFLISSFLSSNFEPKLGLNSPENLNTLLEQSSNKVGGFTVIERAKMLKHLGTEKAEAVLSLLNLSNQKNLQI
jgi:hypothetical protein